MAGVPLKINLIARTNGVGLDRDVDLVAGILESAGHQITRSHCRAIPAWHRFLPGRADFDFNIFMERIFSRWLPRASCNLLIPNQERFPKRHLHLLKKIDHVLCKTDHAHEIFSKHHPSCHKSGFTSKDLRDEAIAKEENSFLHVAGRSTLKGTETILDLWKKHPEWPTLLLLQHHENAPYSVPENVTLRSDYLSNADLDELMNGHRIHLCPSRSEGWGHYLAEAMSCGAIVVTTDGPPMNELVSSERGILVKATSSEPRHLGVNYYVDATDLEASIGNLLKMAPREMNDFGKNARKWFSENDTSFRNRLPALLESFRS